LRSSQREKKREEEKPEKLQYKLLGDMLKLKKAE